MIKNNNRQFQILKQHLNSVRGSGDYRTISAWRTVIDSMLIDDVLEFDLIPGHTKFSEWIVTIPVLDNYLYKIDNGGNSKMEYDELAIRLLRALYPDNSEINIFNNGLTLGEYGEMKQLFEQLCSYNIAFLDTNRDDYSYFLTALVGILPTDTKTSIDGLMNFPQWDLHCKFKTSSVVREDTKHMAKVKCELRDSVVVDMSTPFDRVHYGTTVENLTVDKMMHLSCTNTTFTNRGIVDVRLPKITSRYALHLNTNCDETGEVNIQLFKPGNLPIWLVDGQTIVGDHLVYNGYIGNYMKEIRVNIPAFETTIGLVSNNSFLSNGVDLRGLYNLEYLDLKANNIKTIEIPGLEKLTSVELNNNNISRIVLNYHPRLKMFDVSDNGMDENILQYIVTRLHEVKDNLSANQCVVNLGGTNTHPNNSTIMMIDEMVNLGCVINYT